MMARHSLLGVCRAGLVTLLSMLASSSSGEAFRVLKTFQNLGCPSSDTVRDANGNLYATTACGGDFGAGAVIKLAPSGKLTVLYSFAGGNDGANPQGPLLRDATGNLYGTTRYGGTWGFGTIYKVAGNGTYSLLHSFQKAVDGYIPNGGLIRDPSGSLYGTASSGGPEDDGTVFKLAPDGTFTVLHSFTFSDEIGYQPTCCLVSDAKGNLYGTTSYSGFTGDGTVFRLAPDGTPTMLYRFSGGADGAGPFGLVRSGNTLYGLAGPGTDGPTIFKLTSKGVFTVLYSLSEVGYPRGGLARDVNGNLYGVSPQGGSHGQGAIFRLAPDGTFAVVYDFTGGDDGGFPDSRLVLDAAGNVYGTASYGGAGAAGTVFKVAPDGSFTLLRALSLHFPSGGLALDSSGNIFGTTERGGDFGEGAVFELSRADRSYTEVHSLGGLEGDFPVGDLLLEESGDLYGTTLLGGPFGNGTAFKLATDGSYTVLHAFGSIPQDGSMLRAGLAADESGNLYGTASFGGPLGGGILFKLGVDGSYNVLHGFSFFDDGSTPVAAVVVDGSGNLYGTASQGGAFGDGAVFKFASDGTYSVLHSFAGSDGGNPLGALILDPSGNLYGTTSTGGATGLGNVFTLAPDGTFTSLHDFAQAEGATPKGSLTLDVDGSLYGTTSRGGASDRGTVFKLASDGTYTVVHSFTGKDGAFPVGGLRFYEGILFGTTSAGGPLAGGSIFLIRP